MKSETGGTDIEGLGRELNMKLPKAARIVGVTREQRGDAMTRVKLVMSAQDWNTFIAGSPVKLEQMEPGSGGFLGQDAEWWDPHAAPKLRTGQTMRAPGTFMNIGFDDSRPDAVAVYIVQHGT